MVGGKSGGEQVWLEEMEACQSTNRRTEVSAVESVGALSEKVGWKAQLETLEEIDRGPQK